MHDLLLRGVAATLAGTCLLAATAGSGRAAVLYAENFDADATTGWTVNDPGVTDVFADFFFDYGQVGIPSAPGSAGGTTRGMMLQANLGRGVFGGFSVSPSGKSFTGDFRLSFDYWGNTHQSPVGTGTSNLSYFGFATSGTAGNYPGVSDGVWFAVVADGDSSADVRVYDYDQRKSSYQVPGATPGIDNQASYPVSGAGTPTRNAGSAPILADNFGSATPPAAMQAAYPNASLAAPTNAGALAFAWQRMEIVREGDVATWLVNGLQIVRLDMSHLPPPPGNNILFGHSDINNASAPATSDAFDLLFTLIDNVSVSALEAPAAPGDFNGDGAVDAADFAAWESQFGNGRTGLDLLIWQANFGGSPATTASLPEPAGAGWFAAWAGLARRRRRIALAA